MKRDMDLIREILLEIEKEPFGLGHTKIKLPDYDKATIYGHIRILAQAGLIDAEDHHTIDTARWYAKHLTWEGHEFLEASRDESQWKRAIAVIKEKGGALTFDMLKTLLHQLARDNVLGN